MAQALVNVELGFVEKCASWKLGSKFFVSKVGGRPAWLRLKNLPSRSNILCSTCRKPMLFLLQVYASITEIESAFHRTIFIFMCANGKCFKLCNNQTFIVFRSQLPCENEFYSSKQPNDEDKTSSDDPSAEKYQPLCICGCIATLKCFKCLEVDYCSIEHRDSDWDWNHQSVCGKNVAKAKRKKGTNQFLLPEYELIFETEDLPPTGPEKSDAEKMKEYRQFMMSAKAPKEMQNMPLDDVDAVMNKCDKAFNKFQKRIKLEPEQVLRYHRGGTPLWVSAENVPSPKDIPDCSCGAKRVFEFQVMPQLLNHLCLDSVQDSIDWGTLAVYTCSKSCGKGVEGYVEEFLWRQDFSDY